jgi:hypothetical protein
VEEKGVISIVQGHALIAVDQTLSMIPFCYFITYFLIPRFFVSGDYRLGLVILVISILGEFCLGFLLLGFFSPYINPFLGVGPLTTVVRAELIIKMIIAINGPLVCCGVMGSIKFLKDWHNKQIENAVLMQENAQAELQLLKAQVNPHFLFNTLNNIFSFTLSKSPLAADMIERLSNIFFYMTSEGQKALVPLDKEIQMIEDYISVEKVRYGDRLDIAVDIKGISKKNRIAPLLLIPFVENSFKHGSSKILKDPKVKLSIAIENDTLYFVLCNNKPVAVLPNGNGKNGIGLKNVQKRLQLLYPNKHQLKIESKDYIFSVTLMIILQDKVVS